MATAIEHTKQIGNREYRVERFETAETRTLRWDVVSQPINAKTGKGWQSTKKHASYLKTSAEALREFNKIIGATDEEAFDQFQANPVVDGRVRCD